MKLQQLLFEVKYAQVFKDVIEVHKKYADFFHDVNKTQYGDLILVDHYYYEGSGGYAALRFWVSNKTQPQARSSVQDFMKHFNLPYTTIVSSVLTDDPEETRTHSRVNITAAYKV